MFEEVKGNHNARVLYVDEKLAGGMRWLELLCASATEYSVGKSV
jgi:hypothetical protein